MQKFNVSKEYRLNITTTVEMEEVNTPTISPPRYTQKRRIMHKTPFNKEMHDKVLNLKPGDMIEIPKSEWPYRTHPAGFVSQPVFRAMGQQYKTRTNHTSHMIMRTV